MIDTSDMPEWTAEDFAKAMQLTAIYKPRKKQITTNVDVDVLLWLKSAREGYQGRLNAILRDAMIKDYRRKAG